MVPEHLALAVSPEHDVLWRVDLPREDSVAVPQMRAADACRIADAVTMKADQVNGAKK